MSLAFGLAHPHWFQLSGKFNPLSLFSAGEQGIAVPDLTPGNGFLFQDSAGTTPVTAYEQPVGLILDRSKGLVLGPELVTNGDFSTNLNGWNAAGTDSTHRVVWSSGAARYESDTTTPQLFFNPDSPPVVVSGRCYQFSVQISYDGGSGQIRVQGANGFPTTNLVNGVNTFIYTATASGLSNISFTRNAANVYCLIDNVSFRELPGNHIVQATSTKRPTLSARYNVLTRTEDFLNAAWTPSTATPSSAGSAPNGSAAWLVYPNSTGNNRGLYNTNALGLTSASARVSFLAKASGKSWVGVIDAAGTSYVNVSTGTAGTLRPSASVSFTDLGGGWFRVDYTTAATGTNYWQIAVVDANGSLAVTANGTDGVIFASPDVRRTIDTIGMPAYQRVGASNDYDTAGFFPYLAFDGTDDSMATAASVDFTGTDKMTVSAGVTKLSDAAYGQVIEASADWFSNNGAFALSAPFGVATNYGVVGKGTTAQSATSSATAPISNVLSGFVNISSPFVSLRVNGSQTATNTFSQGTGNFGNYPVFLGARNNASLFFNGRLYPFFIRGAATDAGLIAQVEQFLKARMPVSF